MEELPHESDDTAENCKKTNITSPAPDAQGDLPLLIVTLFLATFTLSGSTQGIVAILSIPRLRTKSNAFLVSLAVTDLFVGAELIPIGLSQIPTFSVQFQGQDAILGRLSFLSFVISTNTVCLFNMLLVATDRWIYICRPLAYEHIVTTKRVTCSLVLCWTIGTIYGMNHLVFLALEKEKVYCSANDLLQPYYYYVTPILTIALSICIFFIYVHLFIVARRTRTKINRDLERFQTFSLRMASQEVDIETISQMLDLLRTRLVCNANWKTTKMLIAVFAAFVVGGVPISIAQAMGIKNVMADDFLSVLAFFFSGLGFTAILYKTLNSSKLI